MNHLEESYRLVQTLSTVVLSALDPATSWNAWHSNLADLDNAHEILGFQTRVSDRWTGTYVGPLRIVNSLKPLTLVCMPSA